MAVALGVLSVSLFAPGQAGASPGALNILIVQADGPPSQLIAELEAQPGVASVTDVDGGSETPSLATMQANDVVVYYSNYAFVDPAALGDNLADYVDGGGIAVGFNFAHLGEPNWPNHYPQGRWDTSGYSPFTTTSSYGSEFAEPGTVDTGNPLLQGITLNAQNYFRAHIATTPGTADVARYSDDLPMIATKGNVVAVNAYPQDGAPWFAGLIINAAGGNFSGTVCTITGTLGVDRIRGTSGNDVICGLDGDDFLDGRGGNDTIIGGDGVDTLVGKAGNDTLVGGLGNDLLLPGAGDDSVDGGDGTRDRVLFSDITGGGVHVLLASGAVSPEGGSNVGSDTLSGIEQVFGSPFNDVLIAQIAGVASTVKGGAGDDQLDVGDGDGLDRAVGNQGDDTCVTDAGDSGVC
jgi:Ca2+-binding RTX toxin-like protein